MRLSTISFRACTSTTEAGRTRLIPQRGTGKHLLRGSCSRRLVAYVEKQLCEVSYPRQVRFTFRSSAPPVCFWRLVARPREKRRQPLLRHRVFLNRRCSPQEQSCRRQPSTQQPQPRSTDSQKSPRSLRTSNAAAAKPSSTKTKKHSGHSMQTTPT